MKNVITVNGNEMNLTDVITAIKNAGDETRVHVRENLKGKRGRPSKYTAEEKEAMRQAKLLNPAKRGRPAKSISQEEFDKQVEALKAKLK